MSNLEQSVLHEMERLCPDLRHSGGKILVCVSGGIDSVVLLDILHNGGWHVAVAHCNFSLRGEESDGDELFVRELCRRYAVPCHVRKFDTDGYAADKGVNTQIAARELRYDYFKMLAGEYGYPRIAIAHHLDDDIETFFINLLRGTGLKGLSGIRDSRDAIIRPMLSATREEITAYAVRKGIDYREDRTNSEDHYLRNRIRHHIIPALSELAPSFRTTMAENIGRLSDAAEFTDRCIDSYRQKAMVSADTYSTESLKNNPLRRFLLFELLRPFGFNGDTIARMDRAIAEDVRGKWFIGNGHRALLEMDRIRILPQEENAGDNVRIIESVTAIPVDNVGDYRHAPSNTAYMDADKLTFPLTVRRWKPGDRIRPLGMAGSKTVGDFLADRGISVADRDRVEVLIDGSGEIAWIVGIQVSDKFKIDSHTKNVIKL